MQKMNYYICINDLTVLTDISRFLILQELVESLDLKKNAIILIVDENIYLKRINVIKDVQYRKLLQTFLSKYSKYWSSSKEEDFESVFNASNYYNQNCICGFSRFLKNKYTNMFVNSLDDVINIKTEYLKKLDKLELLYDELRGNYNNLLFSGQYSFKNFEVGDIEEIVEDIHYLHLHGMDIFVEKNKDAGEAIKVLKVKFDCSGDNKSVRKNFVYNGVNYKINCNPHIKLNNAHSDKRIYFSWGNAVIGRIVIYYIGSHDGMTKLM